MQSELTLACCTHAWLRAWHTDVLWHHAAMRNGYLQQTDSNALG
jgi:hypothetical protein